MERVILPVDGMTCMSCVQSVERAVSKLPGVVVARGQLEPGQVIVRFDETVAASSAIVSAIRAAGFEVGEEDSHA